MRAVVESDPAPAVRMVLDIKVEARVVVVLVEGVETVVVARCAVGDVPWCGGVVELLGVADAVGHWGKALVHVRMAGVDQINTVFNQ